MKARGVSYPTKLDERNYVYVPGNIRDFLGIESGDYLEVTISLLRRKPKPRKAKTTPVVENKSENIEKQDK